MSYRPHPAPAPLLFGYDPVRDLPPNHLARLVELVVQEGLRPPRRERQVGQPPFDPRLCAKVLVYGYATGIRSSRQLERHCQVDLCYLYLTRGDAPSYRTLCAFRVEHGAYLEEVWKNLFHVAQAVGLERVGRVVLDSTKIRADASPESMLPERHYEATLKELERILAEAKATDAREDAEGDPGATTLDQEVKPEQMRDILRRVRSQQRKLREKQKAAEAAAKAEAEEAGKPDQARETKPSEPGDRATPEVAQLEDAPVGSERPVTNRMRARIEKTIEAIRQAQEDKQKQLCVTDPDAQVMREGRNGKLRECHAFEVAVDNGHLVAGQSTQSNVDTVRLTPLVEAARENEPGGVSAVDADSGYFSGDAVAKLVLEGVDVCIPDSNTASDLHRRQPIGTTRASSRGRIEFTYDAEGDFFRCPENNILKRRVQRRSSGQRVTYYRAQRACTGCPLAGDCLTDKKAVHRGLSIGEHAKLLNEVRQRFASREHRERYRQRAKAVETVFGHIRMAMGFNRWMLRGTQRVAAEAQLLKTAYQLRKVHTAWAKAGS